MSNEDNRSMIEKMKQMEKDAKIMIIGTRQMLDDAKAMLARIDALLNRGGNK